MKYTSYRGTRYEKKVNIPGTKVFGGKKYTLQDVFDNYGQFRGHSTALSFARTIKAQGALARVDPHSGYTAVYVR